MVTDILKNKNADALIVSDPMNMRYISGFKGGEGIVYVSEKQQVLVTDSRYTEAASKESDFTLIEENLGHKREQILKECIAADQAENVVFEDQAMLCCDFEKLEYISSAGLRVLLSAQKIMNKQGHMVIRNVNEDIMEIFEVTGFSDILDIQ